MDHPDLLPAADNDCPRGGGGGVVVGYGNSRQAPPFGDGDQLLDPH